MRTHVPMREQIQTVTYNRKLVQIASDVSEDVIRGAKVAVVTDCSWHIFGRQRAHSFDLVNNPLPGGLTCPVVDVSRVKDDARSTDLITGMIEGRYSMAEFMAGMKALGATVAHRQ